MNARNMLRREINKYVKHSCAPSWTYLRDYTGMHGEHNIKSEDILGCYTANGHCFESLTNS